MRPVRQRVNGHDHQHHCNADRENSRRRKIFARRSIFLANIKFALLIWSSRLGFSLLNLTSLLAVRLFVSDGWCVWTRWRRRGCTRHVSLLLRELYSLSPAFSFV